MLATSPSHSSQGILMGASFPVLVFFLFALLFFGIHKYGVVVPTDIQNEQILSIFSKYSAFFGAGIGLLSMIGLYILFVLCMIFGCNVRRITSPLLTLLVSGAWAGLGYQFVFLEPRNTDIARAIIDFCGAPLLWSSAIIAGLSIIWLVVNLVRR
jgi:hypothetical protein